MEKDIMIIVLTIFIILFFIIGILVNLFELNGRNYRKMFVQILVFPTWILAQIFFIVTKRKYPWQDKKISSWAKYSTDLNRGISLTLWVQILCLLIIILRIYLGI